MTYKPPGASSTAVTISTNAISLVDSGSIVIMAPSTAFAQLVPLLGLVTNNGQAANSSSTYFINCTANVAPLVFTIGGQQYNFDLKSTILARQCETAGPMQGFAPLRIVNNTHKPSQW